MRLKDENARQKIRLELDTNFFVEAGAGSGKTYCLVERMANLVKSGKAELSQIAAVTFTRKAAAELKERFQIKLETLRRDPCLSGLQKENIVRGLANLEQVFIGTIHSFCANILRERPIEAGIDPGFEEIEQEQDMAYAKDAWHCFVDTSYKDGEQALSFMDAFGITPDDLQDTYLQFVQYPDVDIVTTEAKKPDFSAVKEPIRRFLDRFEHMLAGKTEDKEPDKLQTMLKKAIAYVRAGYMEEDRLIIKLFKELSKKAEITQNRWPNGNGDLYKQQMADFQAEIICPALASWHAYAHKILADFAKKGALSYCAWRRAFSVLNFEDLLGLTASLFKDNPEVRAYFQKKYTHILVDEFQDTDPMQAEMILFLSGSDRKETDWKKTKPRPGSLFLVGDPKQSIYRFRRADIDIYHTVKNIFCDQDNQLLSLHTNFRSLPFLQEVVEEVFRPGFAASGKKYQADYSPLETERQADRSYDCGFLENPVAKISKNNAADVAAADAKRIASWISDAVRGGIRLQRSDDEKKSGLDAQARYGDFLILTKKKANLCHYGRALEKVGIPYDISGSLAFSQSEELREIVRLFRAIDDERDPVCLITALRGLFFGFSDKDIYDFKKAGGRFSYFSEVPVSFPSFRSAFERLRCYRKTVDENRPLVAAQTIIEQTGLMPLVLSEEEGLSRAGNVCKALALLEDLGSANIETFYDLIKTLEKLSTDREIESMGLLASKKDVVRLMNVHKAKGLEAPVVLLADPLGESKEFEPFLHIDRTDGNTSKGYFAIARAQSSHSKEIIGIPPDWQEKCLEEKRY
jgi:ATP-dependent helicase/nuclease subunit A